MDALLFELLPYVRQGYNCSQLLLVLAQRAAGEENPALLASVRGLGHGTWRFVDMYFRKLGLLDGRAGFLMAAHTAFYTFLKYVRIHEGGWGAPFDHCPIDENGTNPESKRG